MPAEIHELSLSNTVPRTGNLPTAESSSLADAGLVVLGAEFGQYGMTAKARAGETAAELTAWKSDSVHIYMRTSIYISISI